MDAASLLTGLLLGALLATAVTLGLVSLTGRRRPQVDALEPVHESLDHLHRVLGSDGGLGGFRWGTPVKRWLLDHEAAHAPVAA